MFQSRHIQVEFSFYCFFVRFRLTQCITKVGIELQIYRALEIAKIANVTKVVQYEYCTVATTRTTVALSQDSARSD